MIECSAAALLLHSFYNGIENILLFITKYIGTKIPSGTKWHSELLDNAFIETDNRPIILRNEIKEALQDYLSFRHFVRHNYGFRIRWEKLEDKIQNLGKTWQMVKEDIEAFMIKN
jgi:hypothetical protein